jgi:hypothetical protein
MRTLLLSLITVASFAGCYAEETAYVGPGGGAVVEAGYEAPDMVVVEGSPGVQVVYDAEYPVFYNGGAYWRYDGGVWYSSRYHDRGWAVRRDVPYEVRGVRNPEGYRHYHPAGYHARERRREEHRQERREERREEHRQERREERHEEHRSGDHGAERKRHN